MKLKIETTDEEYYIKFLIEYVKENKKQTYKITNWGITEKNNEKWYTIEIENIEIK